MIFPTRNVTSLLLSPATPEEALERKEEVLEILRILRELPERDRVVFELHVWQGFSEEEVARIMDITPADVTRIVESIKALVRDYFYH
jgi:RNA polymerase sigma factor (sigma-70 family)